MGESLPDKEGEQEASVEPSLDLGINDFNRELFEFLDALEVEEPEENKIPAKPFVDIGQELHRMYGSIWGDQAGSGSMLDYAPMTGSFRPDGPIDFGHDRQNLLLMLARDGAHKGETSYSRSPWLTVAKGDGEGQIYYLETLPDGRDGVWREYPVQIRNSAMIECINRNIPCDEPEVIFSHYELLPGKSLPGPMRTRIPGVFPAEFITIPAPEGPPEDKCVLEFPHANFLLPESDPRHPVNWTQVRVRNYLRRILYPALGIAEL